MNKLDIFTNEEFGQIRTLLIDNEVLFCASDIAKALGYSNDRDAVSRHCKGVVFHDTFTDRGLQNINYIKESDVYRLIVKSKLPKAVEFEVWVFDEVLPSIRKHGAYMTPEKIKEVLLNPDTIIQLATTLKAEQTKNKELQKTIESQEPSVLFAKSVQASESSILIGELAKLLKQNGYDTGQKRLFEQLRQEGYLMKTGSSKNMPTQMAITLGLI